MKLDWRWQAIFYNENLEDDDAVFITQPEDDRYSKHDDNADWNPSSYRDFLDYFKGHKDELYQFRLFNKNTNSEVVVDFSDLNKPYIIGEATLYDGYLANAQPVYYRKMKNEAINGVFGEPQVQSYVVGFQGQLENGKNFQHTIEVV